MYIKQLGYKLIMSTLNQNDLQRYIEDDLVNLIGRNNIKFCIKINPKIITSFQYFFKNFVPQAESYLIIVPHSLDKKTDIIANKDELRATIFFSSKLKDEVLIIGKK